MLLLFKTKWAFGTWRSKAQAGDSDFMAGGGNGAAIEGETAIEGGFLPDMSEDDRKRFTPSELMLYKHALEYKWTDEELKKVIAMLRNQEFDSKEVDPDLHKRMKRAVQDGRIPPGDSSTTDWRLVDNGRQIRPGKRHLILSELRL